MIVSADQLFADYKRLGSVHRVGKELGMHGQTVLNRINAAGYDIGRPAEFTDAQVGEIKRYMLIRLTHTGTRC